MFDIIPAQPSDYPPLLAIWEASVRASHSFLADSDIISLRTRIVRDYMPTLSLFYGTQQGMKPQGFIACHQQRIEMLFIEPAYQCIGLGRALITFAIDELGCRDVDVNEQNPKALAFYQHLGFVQTGRSPTDGEGQPYPLLHLTLKK